MNKINRRLPAGVWLLAIERALSGAALLYVVFGGLRMAQRNIQGGAAALLVLAGLLLLVTAAGVWRRKWWGWLLAVIETVAGTAGGIVGVTSLALSFPPELGRGWMGGFIVVVFLAFAAMVMLLIALMQARSFFRDRDHAWRVERWNRLLFISLLSLLIIRIVTVGVVVKNIDILRGVGSTPQSELDQAIGYCDGLDAGSQKDSCYLQIAVAAGEQGDTLPADFCAQVSLAQPQLKFLCIAYARQIESCDAFEVARERALCRGLVSGNVEECGSLEASEQEVCVNTVNGYLEALRQQGNKP